MWRLILAMAFTVNVLLALIAALITVAVGNRRLRGRGPAASQRRNISFFGIFFLWWLALDVVYFFLLCWAVERGGGY